MASSMFPNGAHHGDLTPATEGANFALPPTLEPAQAFSRSAICLEWSELEHRAATGRRPGDHARPCRPFLTGAHPRKTHGADIKWHLRRPDRAKNRPGTNFLLWSWLRRRQAGRNATPLSCAYSSHLSWRTDTTRMQRDNPRLVFRTVFGNRSRATSRNRAQRDRLQEEYPDFVTEDARKLRFKLARRPAQARRYLSSLREVETRSHRASHSRKRKPQWPK